MRIGVLVILTCAQQSARVAKVRTDRPVRRVEVGIDDRAAALLAIRIQIARAQPRPVVSIASIAHDCEDGFDAHGLAQVEIVLAVIGRHVDEAGAAIGGDEIAGQHGAERFVEAAELVHRMADFGSGEVGAFDCHPLSDRTRESQRRALLECLDQRFGNQESLLKPALLNGWVARIDLNFKKRVLNLRPVSQSLVHRDRPRRRRPDHRVRANQLFYRRFHDLERHIDLGRSDVLVFDLGLGQRRFLDRAPHHRLRAAIEVSGFHELHQLGDDGRFAFELHRQIRIGEIRHQAEPFELALLHLDPFRGVIAAFRTEFGARHVVLVTLFLAVLFLDLPLDGQAVAVPAGHEGRVLAHHALRAHHHVLENAVQRMADMHVAIGIGRAVMEDELIRAPPRLAQLFVKVLVLPARQNARLLLREAGFHGKIGLRQEDGVAVIARAGIGVRHRVAPLTHKGRVGKGFDALA